MNGTDIKASIQYRAQMNRFLRSGALHDAGHDWIRMELANHEREMRTQVAREIRGETVRNVAERPHRKGNARVGARAKVSLRAWLVLLLSLIISQSEARGKGGEAS